MPKSRDKQKVSKKRMKIQLSGDAVEAVKEFGKITKRKPIEVATDAFRTYMWILFEQTFGGTITVHHKSKKEKIDLVNFVRDKKAARKYLAPYRHLFR